MSIDDNIIFKETFSPIKAFTSPSKCRENQEIFHHLEKILNILLTNHNTWLCAQNKGSTLCKNIEIIKTKAIEEFGRSKVNANLYPEGLRYYCDELLKILSHFEEIVKCTQNLLKQIKGLVKLNKESSEIFCKTWSLIDFETTIEKIFYLYKNELTIKESITEEIAHCENRQSIMIQTKSWNYPEYTDEDLNLIILLLRQEIKGIFKLN